jgi:hypothetical protein
LFFLARCMRTNRQSWTVIFPSVTATIPGTGVCLLSV